MPFRLSLLRIESLISNQMIINARSNMFPLFEFFPREQYEGNRLKIRVKTVPQVVGEFTGLDGPAHQVKPGDLQDIWVEPIAHRPYCTWTSAELALFAAWDEIIERGQTPPEAMQVKVAKAMTSKLDDTSRGAFNTIHDVLVGALLGSNTYLIDGQELPVSYGHPTITAPSTSWDDAGATIIADFAAAVDEFMDQNNGVPPDHAFYNRKLWAQAFVGNTELRSFIAGNPDLAKQFGIRGGPNEIVEDTTNKLRDPYQSLIWTTIDGPHTKLGSNVERWPVNTIVLAALDAQVEPVLEHSMTKDLYNPDPMWRWESWDEPEPKGTHSRFSDNVAGVVKRPGAVQPWGVVF